MDVRLLSVATGITLILAVVMNARPTDAASSFSGQPTEEASKSISLVG